MSREIAYSAQEGVGKATAEKAEKLKGKAQSQS
jgi:hypothetical protein